MKKTTLLLACSALISTTLISQNNLPGAGNCLYFDGSNDYVSIGNQSVFNAVSTAVSLEAWIKPEDTGHPFMRPIINKVLRNSGNLYTAFRIGYWSYQNNDQIQFAINGVVAYSPIGSIQANKWIHVAGVYDGVAMKIYLNGILVTTTPYTNTIITNTDPLEIGSRSDRGSYRYYGYIDEARVWNVARTEEQIRQNMCQKLKGNEAGLIGYWRFDEDSSSTLYDYSPSGNDGTLTNMDTLANWKTSAIALGDTSTSIYPTSWTNTTLSLAHANNEDSVSVSNVADSVQGIHLYRVDAEPNTNSGITPLTGNNRYFGVFAVPNPSDTTATYTATYYYKGNPYVNTNNEDSLTLFERNNNSSTVWKDANATHNTTNNMLTKTSENQQAEYMLGISACVVNIGNDANICTGDTLLLDAGNKFTSYQWKDSSISSTFTVTNTGTYWVEASDTAGCTASDIVTITVNPSPTVNLGNDTTICKGVPYTLYADSGYTDYLWSTGATTQNIIATSPNDYAVTVTDNNGCSNSDTMNFSRIICNAINQFHVSSSMFQVYPNPNNGVFQLKILNSKFLIQNSKLVIYDMLGQNVYQQQLNSKHQTINTKLDKGIYTMQLISDEEVINKKIVVK